MNEKKLPLNWGLLTNIFRRGECIINGEAKNFNIGSDNIRISNSDIFDTIEIDRNNVPGPDRDVVIFEDCTFINKISLTNFLKFNNLKFINCRFNDTCEIKSHGRNIEISDNTNFKSICAINFSENRDLKITNTEFNSNLNISGKFNKIEFANINLSGEPISELSFKDATIKHSKFENLKFKIISFSDNSSLLFEGDFKKIIYCEKLSLNHTTIGHLIHFENCNIGDFSIDNVGQTNPTHRFLKFSNQCDIKEASIAIHQLDNIAINNSSFLKLNLWGINAITSVINILSCQFQKIILTDVINKGEISFRDIHLTNGQTIGFINSDLGKMNFIQNDFSKAALEFQNSKIMETFIAETDFPRKVVSNETRNHSQGQLAFGQLQMAFQRQGDTIRTLEYHSREIEEHYHNTAWFSKNFLTKFNLFLNMISNYFGRWWGLGIIFTFLIGFIFFCFLLGSVEGLSSSSIFNIRWDFFDSFIKFMNPLRHFDTEALFSNHKYIKASECSYIIDFFARVFITYGYYQIIQAFRRYGRK